MNRLAKYYTDEEIKILQEKGFEFIEKFEQQQKGKLYKDANFMYNRTQLKQMEKAAEKYPNPLNEDDWTAEQLVEHAFQEMVDQSHYFMAIFRKIEKLEAEKTEYMNQANFWCNRYRSEKYLHEATKDKLTCL